MIELRFGGWFQCRLATDPDPYDEPRGVSGYVHAYVGEPDLDRRINFQPPPFMRSHAPNVGIAIDQVTRDGQLVTNHALLGSAVNLLGSRSSRVATASLPTMVWNRSTPSSSR